MTYVGGTLYAPAGFDIELFKVQFDTLVQAGLEVDEPPAIGRGIPTDETLIDLRLKVSIGPNGIEALEQALKALHPLLAVKISDMIGAQEVALRPDFNARIAKATDELLATSATSLRLRTEREASDALQQRLRGMSIDELRLHGYWQEAQRREEAEATYSTEPDYY